MTREEAILWLNEEIRTWENECQSTHPIKEALYVACKALEQEPCNDAVSRVEVLNLIRFNAFHVESQVKAIEKMPSVTPQEPRIGKLIGYIDFLRNTAQGKKKSLNLLEKVVKAELEEIRAEGENFVKPRKGEWIPVDERLPEESDDYLVTNDDGDVEMAYFAHPKDYAISKGEWREIWYEDDVVAWMPLPEPYKGGGKNEYKANLPNS